MEIKKRGRPFGTTKPKPEHPNKRIMVPAWFSNVRKIYSWDKIKELLKKNQNV